MSHILRLVLMTAAEDAEASFFGELSRIGVIIVVKQQSSNSKRNKRAQN